MISLVRFLRSWEKENRTKHKKSFNESSDVMKAYMEHCKMTHSSIERCEHLAVCYERLHIRMVGHLGNPASKFDYDGSLHIKDECIILHPARIRMESHSALQQSQQVHFAQLYSYWNTHVYVKDLVFDLADFSDFSLIKLMRYADIQVVSNGLDILKTLPCRIEHITVKNMDRFHGLKLLMFFVYKLLTPKMQARISY